MSPDQRYPDMADTFTSGTANYPSSWGTPRAIVVAEITAGVRETARGCLMYRHERLTEGCHPCDVVTEIMVGRLTIMPWSSGSAEK